MVLNYWLQSISEVQYKEPACPWLREEGSGRWDAAVPGADLLAVSRDRAQNSFIGKLQSTYCTGGDEMGSQPSETRKPYTRPELREYGDVRDLTQNATQAGQTDAGVKKT